MVELASDAELWNKAGIAAHLAVGFRESERLVLSFETRAVVGRGRWRFQRKSVVLRCSPVG
jgi:hypothetical protein